MKELFSFGHISIYLFGVTTALGVLVALLVASKEVRRRGMSEDALFDVFFYALIGGFLGARLMYVFVYNPGLYLSNPLEILRINAGGMSIHGGILGGVLAGYWRARRRSLPVWQVADIVAPALILGQAIGRIGCDVFGKPMAAAYFWGVRFGGVLVHPVQVYEFTLNYLLFAYLWSQRKATRYQGQLLVQYLIGFSIIRAVVELFRTNPTVMGFLSVSYLLSLVGVVTGLILHRHLQQRYPLSNPPVDRGERLKSFVLSLALILVSVAAYYFVQGG